MRITQGMMMNNYRKALEGNLNRLNDVSDRVSSERKFANASDDPIAAMKTLRAYRQLSVTSQYQQNVKEATSTITSAESTVTTVDKVIQSISATLVQAKNGTYNSTDCGSFATNLQGYQQQLLQTLNATSNDQYVFGGAASGPQPFKIGTADDLTGSSADIAATKDNGTFDSSEVVGKLLYNIPNTNTYVPVSAITTQTDSTQTDYKYSINNPAMKYSMPIDVGLGIGVDASGVVKTGTAFDGSTSALDFIVQSATGTPAENNIIDSLSDAITQLKSGSTSGLGDTTTMLTATQSGESKTTVAIGEKSKMLTFFSTKLTNDNTNIQSRLSAVADIDITAEYTAYQTDMQVYNASLSIGSTILQHTLLDFLK